jgi:hypothetical protein
MADEQETSQETTEVTEEVTQTVDETQDDSAETTEETTEETKEDEEINPDDFTPEERAAAKAASSVEDDDEDIDPEDKARIDKRISKQLSPLQDRIQAQNDEIEVNSYIALKPEVAPFKAVILKHMKHPAYSNIPVKHIASMLMADKMQKIGAQKEREAQRKVAETKNGGSQQRKAVGGAIDWSKATPEQVEAQIAKVKGQ